MRGPLFFIHCPEATASTRPMVGVMQVEQQSDKFGNRFVTTIRLKGDYPDADKLGEHLYDFITKHAVKPTSVFYRPASASGGIGIIITVVNMHESERLFNDILFRGGLPDGYSGSVPDNDDLLIALMVS